MSVVVRRYIDILIIIITFPYSTCISSFLAAASLLLCSFLNVFSFLYMHSVRAYYYNYTHVHEHAHLILSTNTNVHSH